MLTNEQAAPYPFELESLMAWLMYKPGWDFELKTMDRGQGSQGLTLVIRIRTLDSYHPGTYISVAHYMPVPPAAYDVRSWRRWLFEQILLVERHEACEFFRFPPAQVGGKEERPYAPSHGPGNDPYLVREVGTEEDQRTLFTGEVQHE